MSKTRDFVKQERENLKSKVFSMDTFTELLATYINDPEYMALNIKNQNGVATEIESYPVKKFRKVIKNVLEDFGVDKKDSEAIMSEYKFKKKDVREMYDFISELIYLYMNTGKKLNLFKKADVKASIEFVDVDEFEKEYPIYKKNEKTGKSEKVGVSHIKAEKHKKVKADSSTPDWKKSKVINGKLEKVMKLVCKDI